MFPEGHMFQGQARFPQMGTSGGYPQDIRDMTRGVSYSETLDEFGYASVTQTIKGVHVTASTWRDADFIWRHLEPEDLPLKLVISDFPKGYSLVIKAAAQRWLKSEGLV